MATDPLARIARANERSVEARNELQAAVDAAREAGYSWADIAEVLSVTKQAAWRRFSHPGLDQ